MEKYFWLIFCLTLQACGPGAGDFSDNLGAGYTFHYTNSTGQFITSSEGVVIETVILDFVYDKNFIAAVSLESKDYTCSLSLPDGRKVSVHDMAFVDNMIFTVIDKKSKVVSHFSNLVLMKSYLLERGFSKRLDFDVSKKDVRLRQMPLSSINLDECSQYDPK